MLLPLSVSGPAYRGGCLRHQKGTLEIHVHDCVPELCPDLGGRLLNLRPGTVHKYCGRTRGCPRPVAMTAGSVASMTVPTADMPSVSSAAAARVLCTAVAAGHGYQGPKLAACRGNFTANAARVPETMACRLSRLNIRDWFSGAEFSLSGAGCGL